MPRTLILLVTLFALLPSRSLAQASDPPKWDVAVTTGLFEGRPRPADTAFFYADDWYGAPRGGISIGRYWTPHIKTEVEVMTSGEGTRYVSRPVVVSDGSMLPFGSQEYFRLSQGSARVVFQLFDNQWIHPYVLAGVSVDVERQRAFVHEQYRYLPSQPGGHSNPELLVREKTIGPTTVHRTGLTVGGGAKLYFSPRAFARTELLFTHARPAKTASFILGLGIDF